MTTKAWNEFIQTQDGQMKQLNGLRGKDRRLISATDPDVIALDKENLFVLLQNAVLWSEVTDLFTAQLLNGAPQTSSLTGDLFTTATS